MIQTVDSYVANPALWLRSKHKVPSQDGFDADLFLLLLEDETFPSVQQLLGCGDQYPIFFFSPIPGWGIVTGLSWPLELLLVCHESENCKCKQLLNYKLKKWSSLSHRQAPPLLCVMFVHLADVSKSKPPVDHNDNWIKVLK